MKDNIETKAIPVDGKTLGREIFGNLKVGDKVHWETHNGVDKYDGLIIEKDSNYLFAVSRRYVKEEPEGHYFMGLPGKVKLRYGNSIREKCFELNEEDKIRYWGETRNVYFEENPPTFKAHNKYPFYDMILKEVGL